MSVASYNALLAKLRSPTQEVRHSKLGVTPTGSANVNQLASEWLTAGAPLAGSAPGAAAICTNATAGALGQSNKFGTDQRAWLRRFDYAFSLGVQGTGIFLLVDRLAHVGGLSGIVTAAQTVGFPALTRSTSGVGVWAAAEIYTAVGATGTTLTSSYTNTVPTSGRTSLAINIGGTGYNNLRRVSPISLASGDLGMTAMATCTVLATTGTAGNFGITLFKTLGAWPVSGVFANVLNGKPVPWLGMMPSIPDNACLQLLHAGGAEGTVLSMAVIDFFED